MQRVHFLEMVPKCHGINCILLDGYIRLNPKKENGLITSEGLAHTQVKSIYKIIALGPMVMLGG